MKDTLLIKFGRTLASIYSNKRQSQSKPKDFAQINMYFRPIPYSILNSPAFYSEQSFDFSPWSPYRQSLISLRNNRNEIILESYFIQNADRIAGGGFMPELLNEINQSLITKKFIQYIQEQSSKIIFLLTKNLTLK